jgi:hypothetical protein
VEEVKLEAHDQGVITGPNLEDGPEDRFKFLGDAKEDHTYALAVNTSMRC